MNQAEGIINLHGGRLPQYRGGSPLNWQIINGEKQIGLSIIQICSEIDVGDILAEETFDFGSNETIADAYRRANRLFPTMLIKVIKQIEERNLNPIPQNSEKARYYGSREEEDSKIDWQNMSALDVHNFVRALTRPLNGAYTYAKGEKLRIWKTKIPKEKYLHQPGKVFLRRKEGIIVMAKDEGIILDEIQPEKSPEAISAKSYFSTLGEYLGK